MGFEKQSELWVFEEPHRGRGRAQIPRPGERIHGFRFYVQAAGAPEIANDTSKDKEEGKDKKGKDKKGKDKKGKDKKGKDRRKGKN
ncbi:hypothetical protein OCS_02538 [Ophiocordyceps sinensis CO18]|uniref:Uncharacterized protein n=1 Tax=Ophiocordyceps sinensis (strain Co18 / CGMCC 3.14243) TaxID=911162 RepID=T5AJ22_OPHSC|nr:hypothetical protein OCS_02538 [Ophiocordyceps sinensis CO18]